MFAETLKDRLIDAVSTLPLDPQRLQLLISDIKNRNIPNNDYLHVLSFIELIIIDHVIGKKIQNISDKDHLNMNAFIESIINDVIGKNYE